MESIRQMEREDLIQIAVKTDPSWKKLGLLAESPRGKFPYRFSYCCGNDRFDAEFSELEAQKLLSEPSPANAILCEFARKMSWPNFHWPNLQW